MQINVNFGSLDLMEIDVPTQEVLNRWTTVLTQETTTELLTVS